MNPKEFNETLNKMAQERIDRNLEQTQCSSLQEWEIKEQTKLANEIIDEILEEERRENKMAEDAQLTQKSQAEERWDSGRDLKLSQEDTIYLHTPKVDLTSKEEIVVRSNLEDFLDPHLGNTRMDMNVFDSGAVREHKEGKGRYDLVSPIAMRRLAMVLEFGAAKHGDRNWEKGMPLSGFAESALRHIYQALEGRSDEDHWAHAMWNLMALMHTEETFPELNDLPNNTPF